MCAHVTVCVCMCEGMRVCAHVRVCVCMCEDVCACECVCVCVKCIHKKSHMKKKTDILIMKHIK